MNREKMAWLTSIALLCVLAFQLPGTLAQRDDDYAFVRTLIDIHRHVSANYAEPVDENGLREGAIEGLMSKLDQFSVYVPPSKQEEFERMLEGSFKGVGIQLEQTEDGKIEVVTPIDGSPALKAGVLAGDIILKVNGESIEGLKLPEVIKKIGGPLGTEVKLTVRHVTGEEAELTMAREEIHVPTVKGYQRKQDGSWDWYICEDPKVAYLRITQFTPETYNRVKEALDALLADGMQGLLLDLRFNPGGRLDQAIQIVDLFIEKGVILSTKGRARPEQVVHAKESGTLPNFPMIVLVNEHSASASEIVAGSLMDNKRAVVLGTRTYGKGSVQELIPLDSDGGELKLTVAYYYLPSGRLVHKKKDATDWGVQPQIVVAMDPQSEARVLRERFEQEQFRRPLPKATTQAATNPVPATQVVDIQLQQAVNTMIALVVFQNEKGAPRGSVDKVERLRPVTEPATQPAADEPTPAPPATAPATVPATVPATRPATVPAE
jgi:carboxyl-terminal processing protease